MERGCSALGGLLVILIGAVLAAANLTPVAQTSFPVPLAGSPLVARATANPQYAGSNVGPPTAPVKAFLNATATGGTPPYTFAWEFGDGSNQTVQNAVHSYFPAGLYIARASVNDSGGRRATSTVVVGSHSVDGVNWVEGQPTPALGSAPLAVSFAVTGMGSLPGSYDWAFGDGHSSNGSEPSHTFADPGVYVARLNVTGSGGGNATYRMTVIVDGSGPVDALATSSIVGLCYQGVFNRVSFRGFAGGGSSGYLYSWQLGEGAASSTERDPVYSYATVGFHIANLTVTDGEGNVATSSVEVAAYPPPCVSPALPVWPLVTVAGIVTIAAIAGLILFGRRTEKRRSH